MYNSKSLKRHAFSSVTENGNKVKKKKKEKKELVFDIILKFKGRELQAKHNIINN